MRCQNPLGLPPGAFSLESLSLFPSQFHARVIASSPTSTPPNFKRSAFIPFYSFPCSHSVVSLDPPLEPPVLKVTKTHARGDSRSEEPLARPKIVLGFRLKFSSMPHGYQSFFTSQTRSIELPPFTGAQRRFLDVLFIFSSFRHFCIFMFLLQCYAFPPHLMVPQCRIRTKDISRYS